MSHCLAVATVGPLFFRMLPTGLGFPRIALHKQSGWSAAISNIPNLLVLTAERAWGALEPIHPYSLRGTLVNINVPAFSAHTTDSNNDLAIACKDETHT
jgi:hypothetical protein